VLCDVNSAQSCRTLRRVIHIFPRAGAVSHTSLRPKPQTVLSNALIKIAGAFDLSEVAIQVLSYDSWVGPAVDMEGRQ
jgi:hypothetical protein